jgi:excisionase family DNA binding protein
MAQETKLTSSTAETVELLGISRNLCHELVRRKEIPVMRLGRGLLVPKKALDDLLMTGTPVGQRQEQADIRCPKLASGQARQDQPA